ncbi:MAG: thioredoxin domain-containing protein [Chloroflexota bacterium]
MSDQPQTPETESENPTDATPQTETSLPTEQAVIQPTDDMVLISRTTINYVVIAVMFFVVGLIIGAVSFSSSENVNQEAIEVAIQNALVDAGLAQPRGDMQVLVDDDPFLGPEDAPIVIVEFSAYACPFCGRHFDDTLVPLLENYGEHIRYVYRDFPSINQDVSVPAALAANCAREQDAFWSYHETLFADQTNMIQSGGATSYFVQVAADLGLDTATFTPCLTNDTYIEEVSIDFNTGRSMGITGTPSFYINGTPHSGAQPYAYFETIIRRELTEAGIDF